MAELVVGTEDGGELQLGSPKPPQQQQDGAQKADRRGSEGVVVNNADVVQFALNKRGVVMFSQSWCPFCLEAKRLLTDWGVDFYAVEVDGKPGLKEQAVQSLREVDDDLRGMASVTFPQIFVATGAGAPAMRIGGCTDLSAKHRRGELDAILGPFAAQAQAKREQAKGFGAAERKDEEEGAASGGGSTRNSATSTVPLDKEPFRGTGALYFPPVADDHVIRTVSGLAVATTVVIIILGAFDYTMAKWINLLLAIDYLIRFTNAAPASVLGQIAAMLTANMTPNFRCGPPKQFAAFCGLFLSAFSALLYMLNQRIAALVVIGMLTGAASLEFFFGFCLGCFIFGKATELGVTAPNVYCISSNLREHMRWAYTFTHTKRGGEKVPLKDRLVCHGQNAPSRVDILYKNRTDEQKLEDFDIVRHCNISYFGPAVGVAALALAFKAADEADLAHEDTWRVLGVVSLILYLVVAFLYGLRALNHFNKVRKEWWDSRKSAMFAFIGYPLIIYSYLVSDTNKGLANALVWIGAVVCHAVLLHKAADWIGRSHTAESIDSAMLFPAIGSMFAGLVFKRMYWQDTDDYNYYPDLAWFFYAPGLLIALLVFAAVFRHSMSHHHSDGRARPALMAWAVVPAIAGLGWAQLGNVGVAGEDLVNVSFQMSAALIIVFTIVAFQYRFFGTGKFDMSAWVYVFVLSIFAFVSVQWWIVIRAHYPSPKDSRVGRVVALGALGSASFVAATVCAATFAGIVGRDLFTPYKKWGPMSFVKLSHEAFRVAMARLEKTTDALEPTTTGAHTVDEFFKQWEALEKVHDIHATYEEAFVFPEAQRLYPGMAFETEEEHHEQHAQMQRVNEIKAALQGNDSGDRSALVSELRGIMSKFIPEFLAHLRHEEDTVGATIQKTMHIDAQKRMMMGFWTTNHGDSLQQYIAWVLNNLPIPEWRVRFVRTFIWTAPENAQTVGRMVYRGVDYVTYLHLRESIPEMTPRYLFGYTKAS